MKRERIVAGNWKMNLNAQEATLLAKQVAEATMDVNGTTVILFPSFPFLSLVYAEIANGRVAIGAQDCSSHEKGAYTGEVGAGMLSSLGCRYVLIGHSERRTYFNESSALLINKIRQVLQHKMRPVFCFGEKLEDRRSGQYFQVVKEQLLSVLSGFELNELQQFILAYEPVWAIGTGETATPQQAQEMHAFIRQVLSENYSVEFASGISILYGGSCNAQNAKELFACADVDGGLIGGASLKSADFSAIMHSF